MTTTTHHLQAADLSPRLSPTGGRCARKAPTHTLRNSVSLLAEVATTARSRAVCANEAAPTSLLNSPLVFGLAGFF